MVGINALAGETAKAEFDITPAPLMITADELGKVYGSKDPKLTYTVEGLQGKDKMSGALVRAKGEDVGTYEISLGNLTAGDNYELVTFTGATFTITPATLTITADELGKVYGGKDPKLTYTVEGLQGKDKMSGALVRAKGENVGTYEISLGDLTAGGNYELTAFTGATFTINPAAIPAVEDIAAVTYTGSELKPTVTIPSLKKGKDFTVSYSKNVNAGTATVTVTGKGNYTGTVTMT